MKLELFLLNFFFLQESILLRDLVYSPARLETWQQLAALYQEAFR